MWGLWPQAAIPVCRHFRSTPLLFLTAAFVNLGVLRACWGEGGWPPGTLEEPLVARWARERPRGLRRPAFPYCPPLVVL